MFYLVLLLERAVGTHQGDDAPMDAIPMYNIRGGLRKVPLIPPSGTLCILM